MAGTSRLFRKRVTLALAGAGLLMAGQVALAGIALPESVLLDKARFHIIKTEKGIVRVDRKTGEVSSCTRENAGYTCRLAADDRQAYEKEIERLQADIARLKTRIGELGDLLAAQPSIIGPTPKPGARKNGQIESGKNAKSGQSGAEARAKKRAEDDAEFEKNLDRMERFMRRFMGIARELERMNGDKI